MTRSLKEFGESAMIISTVELNTPVNPALPLDRSFVPLWLCHGSRICRAVDLLSAPFVFTYKNVGTCAF